MAMRPVGNTAMSEKVQFSANNVGGGSGSGGNEIHQRQQWIAIDERDGFISWLRAEFAAANAIIDSLCQHLRTVGDPGEYDYAIGCIQQRRCNWNPVLHMTQYFSVGEVIGALQQAAFRKQQQQHGHRYYNDQPRFKRFSGGYNWGQRGAEAVKEGVNSTVENGTISENEKLEDIKSSTGAGVKSVDKSSSLLKDKEGSNAVPKSAADSLSTNSGISEKTSCGNGEAKHVNLVDQSCSKDKDSQLSQDQNEKQHGLATAKTFVATETIDGKQVNVVDGLKLYELLLDDSEVSKLFSLVNDWRTAGAKGQTSGQTYVVSRRPTKGHGREMIQFGFPIVDAPSEDGTLSGTAKDRRVETIPTLLQDIIERLIGMQVIAIKPDSCVVDIYNEGEYSQPHMFPPWYGRPVSTLFLTECDLVFGKAIGTDQNGSGDYRGPLKLPLTPGSLLVMQGKSADFSKHAIPSIRKQRILVTFTKFQPKKYAPNDGQRMSASAAAPSSHWGPPPIKSPNHMRHPVPKHYGAIPTNGVLPAPPIRPQMGPPNGVQPLFVAAPIGTPIPFAAPVAIPPVSTAWQTAPPPRRPSNQRLPAPILAPGTGVFLPPSGSGDPASSSLQVSLPQENGEGKSYNGGASAISSQEKIEGKSEKQYCNGNVDGSTVTKGEDNHIIENTTENN